VFYFNTISTTTAPSSSSNNNRRPPFRSNNEGSKFSNNDNFQRKVPGRNNHNAVKLIEKYNDLAREALANEDKILSENYLQHADHFTRIQNEQESLRLARVNSTPTEVVKPTQTTDQVEKPVKNEVEMVKKIISEPEIKKAIKPIEKKTAEKKPTAI
jgi:hypothetical protein